MTPLLAESWTLLSRSEDVDLQAAQGTFKLSGRRAVDSSKDVKYSFERAAAKDSTNKEKAFFASIESIDALRPDHGRRSSSRSRASRRSLHLGMNTAVIVDEKSAAANATNPVGTGPYKLGNLDEGLVVTLEKWDGYRDAAKIPLKKATFRFITDPSAQVAALLAGDVDAFPRFADVQRSPSSRTIRASR